MGKSKGWYGWAVATLLAATILMGCEPRVVNPPTATGGAALGPALPPPTSLPSPTPRQVSTPVPAPTNAPPTASALPATTVPTVAPVEVRVVPPKAGAVAYDFKLQNLEGQQVALSSFRGRKVMLNFWATWCGPCRYEIPFMVKLHEELRDQGFEIVAVNLREDAAKVSAFAQEYDMTFPILLDPSAIVGAAYFVRGIPTSVFINEQGVITAVHTGALTDELLRQYVSALMQ